jgi:hypothetical protein
MMPLQWRESLEPDAKFGERRRYDTRIEERDWHVVQEQLIGVWQKVSEVFRTKLGNFLKTPRDTAFVMLRPDSGTLHIMAGMLARPLADRRVSLSVSIPLIEEVYFGFQDDDCERQHSKLMRMMFDCLSVAARSAPASEVLLLALRTWHACKFMGMEYDDLETMFEMILM